MPRVAYWLLWTAWLWCLQSFLLARVESWPRFAVLLYIVGPPVLVAAGVATPVAPERGGD